MGSGDSKGMVIKPQKVSQRKRDEAATQTLSALPAKLSSQNSSIKVKKKLKLKANSLTDDPRSGWSRWCCGKDDDDVRRSNGLDEDETPMPSISRSASRKEMQEVSVDEAASEEIVTDSVVVAEEDRAMSEHSSNAIDDNNIGREDDINIGREVADDDEEEIEKDRESCRPEWSQLGLPPILKRPLLTRDCENPTLIVKFLIVIHQLGESYAISSTIERMAVSSLLNNDPKLISMLSAFNNDSAMLIRQLKIWSGEDEFTQQLSIKSSSSDGNIDILTISGNERGDTDDRVSNSNVSNTESPWRSKWAKLRTINNVTASFKSSSSSSSNRLDSSQKIIQTRIGLVPDKTVASGPLTVDQTLNFLREIKDLETSRELGWGGVASRRVNDDVAQSWPTEDDVSRMTVEGRSKLVKKLKSRKQMIEFAHDIEHDELNESHKWMTSFEGLSSVKSPILTSVTSKQALDDALPKFFGTSEDVLS